MDERTKLIAEIAARILIARNNETVLSVWADMITAQGSTWATDELKSATRIAEAIVKAVDHEERRKP